jgi:cyclopropane fatty-acyl-phospholipid synthase-like methyltransferase
MAARHESDVGAPGSVPAEASSGTRATGSASAQPDLAAIRAYYDETWWDYRFLWLNGRNQAIHFGYWDPETRTHDQSLVNMNRVLADRIGIAPGMRVLDAGCGIGGSALWLAETRGVQVVGITPVASQVARARAGARRRGLADRVSFEQQDYTATSFPEASFDVVWAVESACHAPDKRSLVREARRLLRPGGRLGMVEYLRTERPLAPRDEALLHSWLSGWAIPDIATREEWTGWLTEEGFADMAVDDITPNVRPSLHRLYRMAVLTYPGESLLRAIRLRTAAQHGNTRGARDQFRALRRGLWIEAILTATAP